MFEKKTFTFRLIILLGLFYIFYMLFALATSVYQSYKFRSQVDTMVIQVEDLKELNAQKPEDIAYSKSAEYITLYAKESLGLYEAGEKIIALTGHSQLVEQGEALLMSDSLSASSVFNQSNPVQWKEYFFGETLSTQ